METITITVSVETMAKLIKLATQENCTVNDLVDFFALEGANNLINQEKPAA